MSVKQSVFLCATFNPLFETTDLILSVGLLDAKQVKTIMHLIFCASLFAHDVVAVKVRSDIL